MTLSAAKEFHHRRRHRHDHHNHHSRRCRRRHRQHIQHILLLRFSSSSTLQEVGRQYRLTAECSMFHFPPGLYYAIGNLSSTTCYKFWYH